MGDTDTVDTTEERGPLMPNPRLKLPPLLHPKLKLRLNPTTDTDTDTVDTMAVPTDTADTVILAKGPLKPNLSLTTDTDTVDTMVDTVDTMAVDTTGVEMDTSCLNAQKTLKLPSGSSHSNSFNLATIPSIF